MKMKLFLTLVIMGAIFSQAYAEAANYYAYCVYETSIDGKKINMNVMTKTPSQDVCQTTVNSIPKSQGKWVLMGGDCTSGPGMDQTLSAIFNNQPTGQIYLSYRNLDGFETRINFVGVMTTPGVPASIPAELLISEANSMKQSLEATGIKDIQVIYS